MPFIGQMLILALQIYTFIIVVHVMVSWLIAFGVINASNPQAWRLTQALNRLVEPVMEPVRRFVPPIGGIDITPIIVIFAIMILQRLIATVFS